MKNDIKAYKKEIIVISIYLVIFGVLFFFINDFQSKYDELKRQERSIVNNYNKIHDNKFTEQELNAKVEKLKNEIQTTKQKLPYDLTVQKVNESVLELANQSGNLFAFKNCKVGTEQKSDSNSDCIYYSVSVSKVEGTYTQYKDFLKLVAENDKKLKVSMSNIERDVNDRISGSMTILFYGSK